MYAASKSESDTKKFNFNSLSSRSVGGDYRRHPLPVHLHGDPLPALPVSISLLGGLLALLRVSAAHHVQGESEGTLLSYISLRRASPPPQIIASEGEHAEASPPPVTEEGEEEADETVLLGE